MSYKKGSREGKGYGGIFGALKTYKRTKRFPAGTSAGEKARIKKMTKNTMHSEDEEVIRMSESVMSEIYAFLIDCGVDVEHTHLSDGDYEFVSQRMQDHDNGDSSAMDDIKQYFSERELVNPDEEEEVSSLMTNTAFHEGMTFKDFLLAGVKKKPALKESGRFQRQCTRCGSTEHETYECSWPAENEEKKKTTHKADCPFNYGHDCTCGCCEPMHADDCKYPHGGDCTCDCNAPKKAKKTSTNESLLSAVIKGMKTK